MKNTALVIMAAGIGSRFGGGIKQLEPVGPNGEIIMDYSIHDAMEAGFNKVIFIIRRDLEKDFKEIIGHRIEKLLSVEYAYQELANTERTISEIALDHGFPNSKALAKAFRKKYGMLPSEFRKKTKKCHK